MTLKHDRGSSSTEHGMIRTGGESTWTHNPAVDRTRFARRSPQRCADARGLRLDRLSPHRGGGPGGAFALRK